MASYLDTLKRVMDGDFEGATDQEKADAVRDVIHVCSGASAAVAWQPFPLVDTILISPIQIAMVQAIGRIYGYKLDQKSVVEILGTFGASLLAQNVIMAAAKLIPFAGWVLGMSMAYAMTYAVGEVSDHYFRNGRGVPKQDLQEMFEKVYRRTRDEKQTVHKGDVKLKEKLVLLKQAIEAGLLTEEEFETKKEELLASF